MSESSAADYKQAWEQLQAWGYLNLSAMFRGMAGPVSDWIRVLPELAALTTRLAEKEAALQARDTQLSAELERADELRERIGREMDRAVAAETRLDELLADLRKGYDIAQAAASRWPESPGVWTGTVCERLGRLLDLEHGARQSEAR